eukprot:7380186-Prymnesium_polylepis.1
MQIQSASKRSHAATWHARFLYMLGIRRSIASVAVLTCVLAKGRSNVTWAEHQGLGIAWALRCWVISALFGRGTGKDPIPLSSRFSVSSSCRLMQWFMLSFIEEL